MGWEKRYPSRIQDMITSLPSSEDKGVLRGVPFPTDLIRQIHVPEIRERRPDYVDGG